MPNPERPPSQVDAARASLELAFRVLAQIGLLTLGIVLVGLFGGLALDRLLNTRPLFTVLLLVGSFPVSLYIIYRVALNAVAKVNSAPPAQPRVKEENHRDDDA